MVPYQISVDDLKRGCSEFWSRERRDAMYKVATEVVRERWGSASDVADGMGVLLLTWNQASYRYGIFDFDRLEAFLVEYQAEIGRFRDSSLPAEELAQHESAAVGLFEQFLQALRTVASRPTRSPVATAKGLHLLAPEFFPLWDGAIASKFGRRWYGSARAASSYWGFIQDTQEILADLAREAALEATVAELDEESRFPKPILKYLDEYNYARFTKGWI